MKRCFSTICVYVSFALSINAGLSGRSVSAADAKSGSAVFGIVHDAGERPIPGATVRIWSANPRSGIDYVGAESHPDCGKSVTTDSNGRFAITHLDRTLTFRLIVAADGYRLKSVVADSLDRVSLDVTLQRQKAANDSLNSIVGRVVDVRGNPIDGAIVRLIRGHSAKGDNWFGNRRDEFSALTNKQGRFQIVSEEPLDSVVLIAQAHSYAQATFDFKRPSDPSNRLELPVGVTVRGRVVEHGQPVAGVKLGIQSYTRWNGFDGNNEIATDSRGEFRFEHMPANATGSIFGIMSSLGKRGSIPSHRFRTNADGSETNVGLLALEPSYRVSGRVVLSDGKPLDGQENVYINVQNARDYQSVRIQDDGTFSANGIPHTQVMIGVYVEGHHLSAKNKTLDPLNPWMLMGTVDQDTDLQIVLLEPGETDYQQNNRTQDEWQKLVEQRKSIESLPPFGVSASSYYLMSHLALFGTAIVFAVLLVLVIKSRRAERLAVAAGSGR